MKEDKNILEQPDKTKWLKNPPKVNPEEMRTAMVSARDSDKFECECWNTKCPNFGDCRKCIVFHLCLKQFPTCQRSLLGDLEEHYIIFSRDK